MDRRFPREPADAGRGAVLPLYLNDKRSVGWWAMVVLLICDTAVVASLIFTYLYLWVVQPDAWPPPGTRLPDFLGPVLISGLVIGAYFLFEAADRLNQRDRRAATVGALVACAVLAAGALALGWSWVEELAIDPTAHSYGASVYTLLGGVAVHLVVGAVMALWCLARLAVGMLDSWQSQTLRVCLVWWRFTAPVALLSLWLIVGFPYVV
jgi:cytochrome c oxidase subunit I+III